MPVCPHPLEHDAWSTQLPAKPQSVAAITVTGQKPQRPFIVSTRQSKPGSAVRILLGSPFWNPQVDIRVWISARLSKSVPCCSTLRRGSRAAGVGRMSRFCALRVRKSENKRKPASILDACAVKALMSHAPGMHHEDCGRSAKQYGVEAKTAGRGSGMDASLRDQAGPFAQPHISYTLAICQTPTKHENISSFRVHGRTRLSF